MLCAEFYKERRTWVDIATLPPHVKNAFLAAEDADFYHHEGLDFFGMARAGIKALSITLSLETSRYPHFLGSVPGC